MLLFRLQNNVTNPRQPIGIPIQGGPPVTPRFVAPKLIACL